MANIAIVCPAYNEEKNLPVLYRRLDAALRSEPDTFAFIFVNDGSRDGTAAILRDLCAKDPRVTAVMLSRNFGHQPALMAGIDAAAAYDAVILMDADLQDLPEAIPSFLKEWRAGSEVVYAIRAKRKESFLKVAAFNAFYRLQQLFVSVKMPLDAGIFSLMDRKVVDAIRHMPEQNRYLVGLRAYAGFRQTGVTVERGMREDGEPRVSLFGLFRLALDGIFAFSTMPLRFIMTFGLLVSLFSFLFAAAGLVARYVMGIEFLHWPFGFSTIFFFGGVQLVSIGVLGEYVGRIYDEVKRRPYYLTSEIVHHEKDNGS